MRSFSSGIGGDSNYIDDFTSSTSLWSHGILVYTNSLSDVTLIMTNPNPSTGGCCGTNGPYQQGTATVTETPQEGVIPDDGQYGGHLFLGNTYDPSTEGAIKSVDFSYYFNFIGGSGVQSGLLLSQGSSTYLYFVNSGIGPRIWTLLVD
jgi:hypothetical protein